METSKVLVLLLLLLPTFQFLVVTCTQFEVGGKSGWKVPKSKDDYNQWASKNRFKVDDTVHFSYKDDAVMVVREDEYDKCHSPHPLSYSNNGNTDIKLDRPGMFYFMSGVQGHCERGQKMIIKVLEPASPPQPSTDSSSQKKNGAPAMASAAISSSTVMLCIVSYIGVFLF